MNEVAEIIARCANLGFSRVKIAEFFFIIISFFIIAREMNSRFCDLLDKTSNYKQSLSENQFSNRWFYSFNGWNAFTNEKSFVKSFSN